MADTPRYPGSPRWAKVFGIIVIILVLLFVVLKITGIGGSHGPGRHMSSGHAHGDIPSSSITEDPAPSDGERDGHSPPEGIH